MGGGGENMTFQKESTEGRFTCKRRHTQATRLKKGDHQKEKFTVHISQKLRFPAKRGGKMHGFIIKERDSLYRGEKVKQAVYRDNTASIIRQGERKDRLC